MTVEEVLRQSGFTEGQIRSMEPRAVAAFTKVLSTAQQAREAAEQAERNNVDFYDNKIVPSLTAWEEEKLRIDNDRANERAELAYYKAQNEAARQSGFIAADAPGFESQPRDAQGRYVAGAPGGTPGSPQFFDVNQVYQRAGDAIGILSDIAWEHQRLYGQPLPISPTQLVQEADRVKLDPATYAARKWNYDGKRAEMAKKQQDDHDAQIRKDAASERDRYWAERVGSNPDVRLPMASKYADNARAVKNGIAPDPLMLSDEARRQATRQAIRNDMQEAEK